MRMFSKRTDKAPAPPAEDTRAWDDRMDEALGTLAALLGELEGRGTARYPATVIGAARHLLNEQTKHHMIQRWDRIDREAGPPTPAPRDRLPGYGVFVGVSPRDRTPAGERSAAWGYFEHERRR
jgi:hypothetical protein